MRQLLWKEWHEQAWKLAFGCVVLSAVAAIGLHARMVADATLVQWVAVLGFGVLPVLAVSGLLPAERAEGGFDALVALPITPRAILTAKAIAGVILVVGPLAVAAAVSLALAGGREMLAGDMLGFYARSAVTAVALLAWMLALTVRLPTEARAALLAVGVIVLWLLASAGLGVRSLRATAFALSPFAAVFQFPDVADLGPGPPLWLTVVVQAVLVTVAWRLAVRLFESDVR